MVWFGSASSSDSSFAIVVLKQQLLGLQGDLTEEVRLGDLDSGALFCLIYVCGF